MIDTLAAKDPSILNTTNSVPRGTTVRLLSAKVWSPLEDEPREEQLNQQLTVNEYGNDILKGGHSHSREKR